VTRDGSEQHNIAARTQRGAYYPPHKIRSGGGCGGGGGGGTCAGGSGKGDRVPGFSILVYYFIIPN